MRNELRFAVRMLLSSKLYTAAAMTTLALGIGAATAVFSVVDATLLRPLPFSDPDRLVGLNSVQRDPTGAEQQFPLSRIELLRWRAAGAFESIDGVEARVMSLTGQGDPIVLSAGAMTSGLFRSLGAVPMLGRVFTDEEEKSGANLLVLSHATWRQRFGADQNVVGRAVTLGGSPFTVVGVMPADFRLLFDRSDVWVPLNPIIEPARPNQRFMFAIGRLRGGVTLQQAQSALAVISTDLAREFPLGHRDTRPVITPLRERLFGPRAASLWMLAVAVTGLLALACANVANLTLGHLARRQGELAVRTLLGASTWQMARLLLTETAVIALCGGVAGVAAAMAALPFLTDMYNGDGLGVVALGLDWRVVVLAATVIATTSIICTIVPALRLTRAARRGEALRISGTRVASGRGERRLRSTLVAVQIALAVMLLAASGTFIDSLRKMLQASPGFSAENVLTMQMLLPQALYPDVPARASFVQRMLERVQQVPGVVSAGTTQSTFLPNTTMMSLAFIEGRPTDQPELLHIRHITPGYFDTLRVPIVEGRAIDARDQLAAPAVCMVSQAFAKKYFPDGNAIGHRMRRAGANAAWMTIVGVAGDVHDNGVNVAPGALFYVPYLQANTPTARVSLVVRTATPPAALADSVRRAIWDVDRNQPIDRVATMEDVFSQGASPERFRTWLVTLFGLAGLALAVVGVYAVAAAAVSARSWEASLRLALGAPRWHVVTTMLRESSWPVIAGVVIGVAGFAAASGSLARFLFQTSGTNASAVAVAATGTLLLALIVSAIQSASLARVSLSQCWRGR